MTNYLHPFCLSIIYEIHAAFHFDSNAAKIIRFFLQNTNRFNGLLNSKNRRLEVVANMTISAVLTAESRVWALLVLACSALLALKHKISIVATEREYRLTTGLGDGFRL